LSSRLSSRRCSSHKDVAYGDTRPFANVIVGSKIHVRRQTCRSRAWTKYSVGIFQKAPCCSSLLVCRLSGYVCLRQRPALVSAFAYLLHCCLHFGRARALRRKGTSRELGRHCRLLGRCKDLLVEGPGARASVTITTTINTNEFAAVAAPRTLSRASPPTYPATRLDRTPGQLFGPLSLHLLPPNARRRVPVAPRSHRPSERCHDVWNNCSLRNHLHLRPLNHKHSHPTATPRSTQPHPAKTALHASPRSRYACAQLPSRKENRDAAA
jgi:hypothetical protein